MIWAVLISLIVGALFGMLLTCVISYDRVTKGKKHWWEE